MITSVLRGQLHGCFLDMFRVFASPSVVDLLRLLPFPCRIGVSVDMMMDQQSEKKRKRQGPTRRTMMPDTLRLRLRSYG